ncbi:hypothetical protein LTR15_004209 [Elasticomyces elasticus]|nr:hypothetical protein LTR15_004209 [Elasticomyces elasticus]
MSGPISDMDLSGLVAHVTSHFFQLRSLSEAHACTTAPLVDEQFDRFKTWSSNVRATASGREGLERRLTASTDLERSVRELLYVLDESLTLACATIRTATDVDSAGQPEIEERELEQDAIYRDITEVTQCLVRLARTLQAVGDDPVSATQSQGNAADTGYTSDVLLQFPQAPRHITDRVGKSLAERRLALLDRARARGLLSTSEDEDGDIYLHRIWEEAYFSPEVTDDGLPSGASNSDDDYEQSISSDICEKHILIDDNPQCPLCQDFVATVQAKHRHVARHLEKLAWLSLRLPSQAGTGVKLESNSRFGVGVSDLVKGVELALNIYRSGFVKENAAGKDTIAVARDKERADNLKDKRYQEFRESINEFQSLLGKLDRSLGRAHARYLNRGPTLGPRPYDPLSEDFENERTAIVGPFLRTLEECEQLLEANKTCRAEAAQHKSLKHNLLWHLSQQGGRVAELRARLLFHAEKIRFVIDRLELELLTDLDAKADDLFTMAEDNLGNSAEILLELNRFRSSLFGFLDGQGSLEDPNVNSPHVAHGAVAARFQVYSTIDAPVPGDIPLVQGFDALLLHHQQSVSSSDQTPEQYLLYLKIRWLLRQIKNSRDYQDARPGLYYKRAVNQIERAVLARTRRPGDLVSYDESVLMDLPEAYFRIWSPPSIVPTAQDTVPDLRMPRANEQQVAHLELASKGTHHSASVFIFKKSNEHFRVVREIRSLLSDGETIIPLQFDTSQDTMIPRYMLPTLKEPCLEIVIFSRNEEKIFSFLSLPDLLRFQTALTGYNVSFDHARANIRCQFNGKTEDSVCLARIQIWQDPLDLDLPSAINEDELSSGSSSISVSEGSRSRHGRLVLSTAHSTNLTSTVDGLQAGHPKLSAIAMITQLSVKKKTRFALVFMELSEGVCVRPTECSCHVDYDACSRLVLGRHDKEKLPLRILYSDVDAEGRPNPYTFNIFPFRLPRGSDFSQLPLQQTKYVVLKFDTREEKRRFHQELILRFKIRDKQYEDRRNMRSTVLNQQNHPQRLDRFTAPFGTGFSGSERSSSTMSLPPQLGQLDTGPALVDSFEEFPTPGPERRQSTHVDPRIVSAGSSTTTSSIDIIPLADRSDANSSFGGSGGSSRNLPERAVQSFSQVAPRRTASRNRNAN